MSDVSAESRGQRTLAFLNYLYLLLMMGVIALILTVALVFQYAYGELPCPLCLLERLAMFGVCFGIILTFRHGFSYQHTGVSLLFALILVIVAERQSLLDIYPRPGHAYIDSAIFGLHMPVWATIIGLVLLFTIIAKMAVIGGDRALERIGLAAFPVLARAGAIVSLYVILLLAINLVSAFLQCGFNECHTYGYQLLGGPTAPPAGGT